MAATENKGYEKRDTNVKKLVIGTIAGVVLILIFLVALNEFFVMTREQVVYDQVLSRPNPDLLALRERESTTLNSYAVLDEEAGIYRIPITRAMELLAEEETRTLPEAPAQH